MRQMIQTSSIFLFILSGGASGATNWEDVFGSGSYHDIPPEEIDVTSPPVAWPIKAPSESPSLSERPSQTPSTEALSVSPSLAITTKPTEMKNPVPSYATSGPINFFSTSPSSKKSQPSASLAPSTAFGSITPSTGKTPTTPPQETSPASSKPSSTPPFLSSPSIFPRVRNSTEIPATNPSMQPTFAAYSPSSNPTHATSTPLRLNPSPNPSQLDSRSPSFSAGSFSVRPSNFPSESRRFSAIPSKLTPSYTPHMPALSKPVPSSNPSIAPAHKAPTSSPFSTPPSSSPQKSRSAEIPTTTPSIQPTNTGYSSSSSPNQATRTPSRLDPSPNPSQWDTRSPSSEFPSESRRFSEIPAALIPSYTPPTPVRSTPVPTSNPSIHPTHEKLSTNPPFSKSPSSSPDERSSTEIPTPYASTTPTNMAYNPSSNSAHTTSTPSLLWLNPPSPNPSRRDSRSPSFPDGTHSARPSDSPFASQRFSAIPSTLTPSYYYKSPTPIPSVTTVPSFSNPSPPQRTATHEPSSYIFHTRVPHTPTSPNNPTTHVPSLWGSTFSPATNLPATTASPSVRPPDFPPDSPRLTTASPSLHGLIPSSHVPRPTQLPSVPSKAFGGAADIKASPDSSQEERGPSIPGILSGGCAGSFFILMIVCCRGRADKDEEEEGALDLDRDAADSESHEGEAYLNDDRESDSYFSDYTSSEISIDI